MAAEGAAKTDASVDTFIIRRLSVSNFGDNADDAPEVAEEDDVEISAGVQA